MFREAGLGFRDGSSDFRDWVDVGRGSGGGHGRCFSGL